MLSNDAISQAINYTSCKSLTCEADQVNLVVFGALTVPTDEVGQEASFTPKQAAEVACMTYDAHVRREELVLAVQKEAIVALFAMVAHL